MRFGVTGYIKKTLKENLRKQTKDIQQNDSLDTYLWKVGDTGELTPVSINLGEVKANGRRT